MNSVGQIIKRAGGPLQLGTAVKETNMPPSGEQINHCQICFGAGWVHPVVNGKTDYSKVVNCKCIEAQMLERTRKAYMDRCELPKATEDRTFETFKVYPAVKEAHDLALQLAEESSDVKWLILTSDVDTGKTHLAISICRRWLSRGKPAKYGLVPLLMEELRKGFDNKDPENNYPRRFEFLLTVPLLVLDDLGTENRTPWVQEKLEEIVDYRYINALPLVVTTNLPMSKLPMRIASRFLRANFSRVVEIKAGEYRFQKNK
jgi:DNA replication protein DnaC